MDPLQPRSATAEMAAARRLLLADGGQPKLDRIAQLAARLLGADSAQVSLVTEVQTIAGGAGQPLEVVGSQTPLGDSLCTVTASCGEPLVVPDTRTDDRVVNLAPVASGAVGSYLGVPLVTADGQIVGALCVFDRLPHDWSAGDVALLEQLALAAAAELELAALSGEFATSRVRWELAVTAAGIGGFEWDLATGRFDADDRLAGMFGYTHDTVDGAGEAFRARVHPEDLPAVTVAVQVAVEEGGGFDVEFRVLVASGAIRWLQAQGRAIADDAGTALRLIGAVSDTTGQRESEAGVVRVLESMSAGFLAVDRKWHVTYVNAEAERILGLSRSVMLGDELWALFPESAGPQFETVFRAAMDGQPGTVEAYYPAPLDAWYEVRASPAPDGLSLYFLDVTTRHIAQEFAWLSARVSEQLSTPLDIEGAVRELAQVVVPTLADWSIVSVPQPDGTLRNAASWHVDPEMRPVLERYAPHHLAADVGNSAVDQARRATGPLLIGPDAIAVAVAELTSPVAIETITQLAPASAVVLRLTARGHLVGILSLCRGIARTAMSKLEVQVAVSIADRAGLALDNIATYTEQRAAALQLRHANHRLQVVAEHERSVARALQDAMLTQLPEPAHLHLVARYLAAARTEQVGGDWYDAVVLPTGATVLMIGDVAGHDIDAAATMGQLRNMLRAFAWDRHDEPPSAIVTRLDHALRDLHLDTLATLAIVQVEPAGDRAHGMRTLRWTNAGHPPPVLVHPDGTSTVLDTTDHDLLLGVLPSTTRHDHTHPVAPGSTLILYTDGLIETRTADIDTGLRRLRDALQRHHRLPSGELLDAVLADMVGTQPEDDVAVLAVRFHPELEPRPGGTDNNSSGAEGAVSAVS